MATKQFGNTIINYTPATDQTQLYNALGRDAAADSANSTNNKNWLQKKLDSAENTVGTIGALVASGIYSDKHDIDERNLLNRIKQNEQDFYKKYGYNNIDEYYAGKNAALDDIYKKYGFKSYDDYDDQLYWAKEEGNGAEVDRLQNIAASMTGDDANIVKLWDDRQNELIGITQKNSDLAKDWQAEGQDFMQNNYVAKKLSQDRGKFLGSGINTLSTAFDVMSLAAGIPNGALVNGGQGALEGIADELEQNGFENFDWGRAGTQAASGALAGAATGALNTKIGNRMVANGGNIINGKNAVTKATDSLLKSGIGRGAISGAVGGATGAATSSALTGQDLGTGISNAIAGAGQGALQGAVAGGVMSGANKAFNKLAPKAAQAMQENVARNASYGDTMREQFKGAWNSGDSPVANRLVDMGAGTDNGFGLRYNKFAGDGAGAIDYLLKRGGGEVEGAVKSPAVEAITGDGNIDLVYGKTGEDGYGLAHIAEKHGTDILKKLPDILQNGEVYQRNGVNDRLYLQKNNDNSVVRLDWDGNKKQWVATAFEANNPVSRDARYTSVSGVGSSPINAADDTMINNSLPQTAQNVNEFVPEPLGEEYIYRPQPSETEIYRTLIGQNGSGTTPDDSGVSARSIGQDLMYGESALGNRTRRGMVADALERLGNTLEGAQTNVTRAAAKDLGIQSTGKVVENIRKKTGLTNLETQGAFARELTGGADSLMDNIQRIALTASETGAPYQVDTTPVVREVDAIVDKYADTNMFGSITARDKFIRNLKTDISNMDSDVISIANRMKANAADLRGKGVAAPTPSDSAKAKIYSEIANKLDDLSYRAIPQENVDAMFDTTISEMRGRAEQAAQNGNNSVARAYNTAADKLAAEPRTIKAYRSFKKDFVDVAKIDNLTAQAENGAAAQMGRSFSGGLKRLTGTLLQRPTTALLAKAGGAVNAAADRIGNNPSATADVTDNTTTSVVTPQTQLYNILGREIGVDNGNRTAEDYLEEAAQGVSLASVVNSGVDDGSTLIYKSLYGSNGASTTASETGINMTSGDYYTNLLARAMQLAMDADDAPAFGALLQMYNEAQNETASNSITAQVKLTDKQRQANAAERALNDFEQVESNFAYDVSDIPVIGAIANLGGNEYKSKAEALALQIGYMLSGATVNKEEAKNIGMAYIPQPRDSEAVRKSKLAQIRGIISDYQQTYSE